MPVKRRVPKQRTNPHDEADAWEEMFWSGRDFFSDLAVLDIRTDRAAQAAAPAAWRRHGAYFLAVTEPRPGLEPWALQTFGKPPRA